MKIHNVRFGFANNSSSTHSLIFIKKRSSLQDKGAYDKDFGWDEFTLVSREAKMDYISLLLWYSLKEITSPEMAQAVVEKWCGIPVNIEPGENYPDGYIDHQSVMCLPRTWDGKGIDPDFFTALKEYMLREDVAILGGNDNSDKSHPLWSKSHDATLPLPRDMGNTRHVARLDKLYNYWTIFNREDGGKIRFSFDHKDIVPVKAYAPELVDLKITNYCPYGCEFCYQDSTTKGQHGDRQRIDKIIRALGELKVFEVALGGGEPTLHPDFLRIIEYCKYNGVVPNFTTKNLAWMGDAKFRDVVKANCGSFAFSANSAEEVLKLSAAIRTYNLSSIPVTIQCVLGVISSFEFHHLLRACDKSNLTLTILGYKDVGRGTTFTRKQETDVLEILKKAIKDNDCPSICVDTEFASKYEDDMKKMKIPSWMYHIQEGKFSAYIDAVEGKMGPSSYCAENEYVSLEDLNNDRYFPHDLTGEITSTFRGF